MKAAFTKIGKGLAKFKRKIDKSVTVSLTGLPDEVVDEVLNYDEKEYLRKIEMARQLRTKREEGQTSGSRER